MSTSKKLSREEEMSLLPSLLKARIEIFRQDDKFEPFEGTEVRTCLLADAIYNNHKVGEDWIETTKRILENGQLPEPVTLSNDNLMLAIDIAKAMDNDNKNNIDITEPRLDDLMYAETINIRCTATTEMGLEGYMARPREEYISFYINKKTANL